jgi:hypothetical protein
MVSYEPYLVYLKYFVEIVIKNKSVGLVGISASNY